MTAWLRAERETVGGDRPPVAVLVVGAVTVALIALPLIAVVATVDLARVPALLAAPSSLAALGLSLGTTVVSTALCTVLGVPLALLLARVAFPGRGIVRLLVLVPLVLPPVVGGIALTSAFGRRGLLGPVLEVAGIEIGFTTAAVILSQCFVAMPFLVLALEGALHATGEDERTAADLGAGPWTRLVRVTLPGVAPALRLGILLAFARAIGEFGATLTFAGSLEGVTRTLPLEIYLQREVDPDAALALSLALMLLAGAVVLVGYAAPAARETRARRRASAAAAGSDGVAASDDAFRGAALAPTALAATGDAHVAADARPLAARVRSEQRGLDVDLDVAAGTRVAVVGANGAGKSSLLAAIAGRYAPTAARIAVGDRILTSTGGATGTGPGTRRRRLVPQHRRGVVLLGQATRLLPQLSVLDNVAFGPRASGTDRAHALERARTMLHAAGIAHLADRRPHTLSGGQAQRAILARALAVEPDVILLDEPFVAVDAASLPGLRETVERLTRGRTTLIVSHDADDVAALADRVLTLDGGRILEDRPVREPAADASTGTAPR